MDLRRFVVAGVRELHPRQTAGLGQRVEFHRMVAGEGIAVAELDGLRRNAPMLGGECGHARLDRAGGDVRRHTVEIGTRRGGGRRSVGNLRRVGRGDADEMQRHAELFGDDLRHLGEQPLPHLGAAVIEMDGAVRIDMHQCARLVERDQGEGDAEHHRRQRDAPFDERVRRIEGLDALAPRPVVAGSLEVVDDGGLGLIVLDRLPVGRLLEPGAKQIGLAHVERIEPALAGDRVHRPLDRDHSLRPAEAAEGGVGDRVGLEPAGGDRGARQPVAVAGVKHRAVDHARREIGRAAAARVEHDVIAGDDARDRHSRRASQRENHGACRSA